MRSLLRAYASSVWYCSTVAKAAAPVRQWNSSWE